MTELSPEDRALAEQIAVRLDTPHPLTVGDIVEAVLPLLAAARERDREELEALEALEIAASRQRFIIHGENECDKLGLHPTCTALARLDAARALKGTG